MALHKNIIRLRKLNDLTQQKMADRLHVSLSTYCRIESGESGIDATLLPKIAESFKIPIEWLFQETGSTILHNPTQHNTGTGIMVQQGMPDSERQNCERTIASLQETIALQKERIAELKEELARKVKVG